MKESVYVLFLCLICMFGQRFCNPFVRERVIAITAATEKVTLHCQGSKQTYMDNMEENEAFKIKVFLDLMDGCQGISIPIQADATSVRQLFIFALYSWSFAACCFVVLKRLLSSSNVMWNQTSMLSMTNKKWLLKNGH